MALAEADALMGVCQQQRLTRVRSAGFTASGLPDEALDALLQRHGRSPRDVGGYVLAESERQYAGQDRFEHVDHHFAHAGTAYLSSPSSAATIIDCDREVPKVSVWRGAGRSVSRIERPWNGPGFTHIYTRFARTIGFHSDAGNQRFEAPARFAPDARGTRVTELVTTDGNALDVSPALDASIERLLAERSDTVPRGAAVAASLQARLGEVVTELLTRVRARTTSPCLCLASRFFYHSSMNTLAKQSRLLLDKFVLRK
jgi:predicted NodU family carbamoyl transferase